MSDDYSAKDALLVAQIGGLRAEQRPDDELCQGYMELVSLRLERGRLDAARSAVEELIAVTAQNPDLAIEGIQAEYLAATVALERGDGERAIAHAELALARTRELDFDADVPHMLFVLSKALSLAGREKDAAQKLEEALERFEESGQPEYAALSALHLSGKLAPEDERPLLDRALALAKASGDDRALGVSSLFRGTWHADRDEYLPARRLLERAITLLRRTGASDDASLALKHLMYLHLRSFALDDAEERASEALAEAENDLQRIDALDVRGLARQRKHVHALAGADFAAAARALWKRGERARALTFWMRVVQNQLLVALHRLRLVRAEPHRDAASERRELLGALFAYLALATAWSFGCAAIGGTLRHNAPKIVLLLVGTLPFLILATVVLLDVRLALAAARARRGE